MTDPTHNSELTDRLFAELADDAEQSLDARLAADPELAAEMAALEATLGQLREGLQPPADTPRELRPDQRQAVLDLAAELDRAERADSTGAGAAAATEVPTASAAPQAATPQLTLWSRVPVAMKFAAMLAVCATVAWLVVDSDPPTTTDAKDVAMVEEEQETVPAAKTKVRADAMRDAMAMPEGESQLAMPAEELAATEADGTVTTMSADIAEEPAASARLQENAQALKQSMEKKNDRDEAMADRGERRRLATAEEAKPQAKLEQSVADARATRENEESAADLAKGLAAPAAPPQSVIVAPAPAVVDRQKDEIPVLRNARVHVVRPIDRLDGVTAAGGSGGGAAAFAGGKEFADALGDAPAAAAPAPVQVPATPAPTAKPQPPATQAPARQMGAMAAAEAAADDADDAVADELTAMDDAADVAAPGWISLALTDATLGDALAAICRQARLQVRAEGAQLMLYPVAFGPMRESAVPPDPALTQLLATVRVPRLQVQDSAIAESLALLVARSRELDPAGVGLPSPLVVLPHPTADHAIAFLPYADAPLAQLATVDTASVAIAGRDVTITLLGEPAADPAVGAAASMDLAPAADPAEADAAEAPADAAADR